MGHTVTGTQQLVGQHGGQVGEQEQLLEHIFLSFKESKTKNFDNSKNFVRFCLFCCYDAFHIYIWNDYIKLS